MLRVGFSFFLGSLFVVDRAVARRAIAPLALAAHADLHLGDRSQLADVALLDTLWLVLNRNKGWLCCTICGVALSEHWRRHCQQHHHLAVADDAARAVQQLLVERAADDDLPVGTPVQGVALANGFRCTICGWLTTSHAMKRKHSHEQFDAAMLQRRMPGQPWFSLRLLYFLFYFIYCMSTLWS